MPNDLKPRVLMVTKPLAPPWNDSSKNLAKDIVQNASNTFFHVLTSKTHPWTADNIFPEPLYTDSGHYAPGLGQNIRVMRRLLKRDPQIDIYHFFFAPNPKTSGVLKLLMKVKRKLTIHTICSEPKSYAGIAKLLFADIVVALSEDTQKKLQREGVANVMYIPPGIDPYLGANREEADLPMVSKHQGTFNILFAGDYEYSQAHETVLKSLTSIFESIPGARVFFACRRKTKYAEKENRKAEEWVKREGWTQKVIFLGEVPDMINLIRKMHVGLFPAGSLYHKMDVPLVLLECLANQVPLVVSNLAPLQPLVEGGAALSVSPFRPLELARAVNLLGRDEALRRKMGEAGFNLVEQKFNVRQIAGAYEQLYCQLKEKKKRER